MVKPRIRRPSPVYLITTPQEKPPKLASAFDDYYAFDEHTSRPTRGFYAQSTCSSRFMMATRPPTLTEILLDTSPPPWTLSAFMAYLSQNHCMETLEFTLDSQRYAAFYDQLAAEAAPSRESNERVCGWWEKLMQVYIIPCAPREVNIPARVRDRLLNLPYGPTPPHPSELEDAGRIIYELMNDSLLVPFLQSVAPLQLASPSEERAGSPRRSSHNSFGRGSGHPVRSSTYHTVDSDGLTDDSDSNSPPAMEPMTPPTTPPTSEYTFNTSPGGFQRAVAAHNKGWKKVGAKLGFSRKGSSRRSTPTSSSTDCDSSLLETSHGHVF